jgi:hypothetical protein
MTHFIAGNNIGEYDPDDSNRVERNKRVEFDTGLGDFFDPAVDTHSSFYFAMERDKHAAHLVAGTSFLDLNNVILRTECNNAYESMNEEDMQKLRKLMWDVYVPHIQQEMQQKVSDTDNATDSFQAQMYVVHLSVRVAQALQLVFELNQKKSFSACVKTAYEVALQDVLYHPALKGKVKPFQYKELINYLRRHEAFSTAFNTYVGYKLLRQQLVRSGGPGTNRKSNDAERLHDESANRLWGVLEENMDIYDKFVNASKCYTMEWHALYYKEVAQTLFHKLADHHTSSQNSSNYPLSNEEHTAARDALQASMTGVAGSVVTANHPISVGCSSGSSSGMGASGGTSFRSTGVDIVSALQEARDTVAEGTSKRSSVAVKNPSMTLSSLGSSLAKRPCLEISEIVSQGTGASVRNMPNLSVRSAFDSIFK